MTSRESTCGLTDAFELDCWGSEGAYTGLGGLVPSLFVTEVDFVSVSIVSSHACALDADGAAWCWGSNWYGQLGTGQPWSELASSVEPLRVTGGLVFDEIVVTESLGCGLALDGEIHCWGNVPYLNDTAAPMLLTAGDAGPFFSLDAVCEHVCGLSATGAAWCWGFNALGELGDGTYDEHDWHDGTVPVTGGLTFTSLGLGGRHSCGVTHAGSLYCWGLDHVGQLGRGR